MTWTQVGEFALKHWMTVFFGLATAACAAGYKRLAGRAKKDRQANKAVRAGVEALLADRMIQLHNYYADKGYCPIYARRAAESLYGAYHDLGGNGTITGLYQRLLALPTEREE